MKRFKRIARGIKRPVQHPRELVQRRHLRQIAHSRVECAFGGQCTPHGKVDALRSQARNFIPHLSEFGVRIFEVSTARTKHHAQNTPEFTAHAVHFVGFGRGSAGQCVGTVFHSRHPPLLRKFRSVRVKAG